MEALFSKELMLLFGSIFFAIIGCISVLIAIGIDVSYVFHSKEVNRKMAGFLGGLFLSLSLVIYVVGSSQIEQEQNLITQLHKEQEKVNAALKDLERFKESYRTEQSRAQPSYELFGEPNHSLGDVASSSNSELISHEEFLAEVKASNEARMRALEKEASIRADEAERLRLAEEARSQAVELERMKADEAERLRLAEEARSQAAELERIKADEAERLRLAEEARLQAAELERIKADEAERLRLAEEARLQAVELERMKADEAERLRLVEEARSQAAELERIRVEEEVRRRAIENTQPLATSMNSQYDDAAWKKLRLLALV